MKKDITNSMYPIVLIGPGLSEMYNKLDTELKKTVSITAGIEDSNMRASLKSQRNICKNTLRKIAKGLDVYPVLFFVSSKHINSDFLKYEMHEGIAHVENFDSFFKLLRVSEQKGDENTREIKLFNENIISELNNLFDRIRLAKKNNLNEKALKQKITEAIISLTYSLLE